MRILGIDPGFGITGFGVVDVAPDASLSLHDFGVITTPANTEFVHRLTILRRDLEEILEAARPDVVSIEKLFFAQNTTTALNVAHARGVTVERIAARAIPIFEYTPLEIKQTVTGFGRATKSQVLKMTQLTLRITTTPTPDDAVDAIAGALCHAFRIKLHAASQSLITN